MLSIGSLDADAYETIDGVVYQLTNQSPTSSDVARHDKIAVIKDFDANAEDCIIHKSIVFNGETYYVDYAHFLNPSSNKNKTISKISIDDDVMLYLCEGMVYTTETGGYKYGRSYVPNILQIGKNVRLIIVNRTCNEGAHSYIRPQKIYCLDENPPLITWSKGGSVTYSVSYSTISSNYGIYHWGSSMEVYVPVGAENNYKHSFGWGHYWSITGLDELGHASSGQGTSANQYSHHGINVSTDNLVTGLINEETFMPVRVQNTEAVTAFAVTVALPERIELVDDVDSFIEATERGAGFAFSASQNEDGTITVTGTTAGEPLAAGEGPVLNLKVKTAWQNTYTIPVTNLTVTTANGEVRQLPDNETKLVMQGVRGDMNGDGRVDASDALYIYHLASGLAE